MVFLECLRNYKKEVQLFFITLALGNFFLWQESKLDRVININNVTTPAWLIEGYNFYKYGISNVVGNADVKTQKYQLFDTKVDDLIFTQVSIYDPIFFPAFCALFWKIIGTPSLLYLKILHIILFSVISVLLFWVLTLLLEEPSNAFICSLGVLSFLPLIYHNIVHIRDVYHYYFFIIFLYFSFTFVKKNKSQIFLLSGAFFIAFCQWIRPPLFSSFVVLSFLLLLWAYFEPLKRTKIYTSLRIFWLGSALFFWLPFITFNKVTYNQYFLSALGENLLSSLYGVSFPDGDVVEHSMGAFLLRKTGEPLVSGTLEGDKKCFKLYKKYMKKYPLHHFKCMAVRVKQMLWYDLPWREYDPYKTTLKTSKIAKLQLAFSNPKYFLEFFARLYMRILLLLAYMGILISFLRKEYKLLVVMLIGVVFSSGYSWLFHIEDRVLAVHNWPFGLFAAYFLKSIYKALMAYSRHKRKICKENNKIFSKGSI